MSAVLAWTVALVLLSVAVLAAEANGEFLYEKAGFEKRHQNLARVFIYLIGVLAVATARYL